MISIIKRKQTGPTFVLAILGDYGRVESALARSIQRLEEIARRSDCRIVAALEDSRWETVPLVQTLGMRFPEDRLTVVCGEYADQPARLFSAAAERAEGEFLQFLWPGCLPDLDAVNAACAAAEAEDLDWLAFAGPWPSNCPSFARPDLGDRFYSYYLACGRWIPLCQAVVRRTSFLEIDGFDASPLLQREFDAEFWLRSVRHGQKGLVRRGSLAETCWTWEDFPLQTDFRVPRYLVAQLSRPHGRPCAAGADRAQADPRFRRRSAADVAADRRPADGEASSDEPTAGAGRSDRAQPSRTARRPAARTRAYRSP